MTRPLHVTLLFLAAACSTRTVQLTSGPRASTAFALEQRQEFQRVPLWYVNPPPRDAAYRVASATALSADMALALQRAELEARNQLAAQLDSSFAGIAELMQRETPPDSGAVAEEFTRLYRGAMSQWLRTVRARDRHAEPEGSGFRAWVRIDAPISEVQRAVVRSARARAQLSAQIVASAAFRDLERQVEASAGTPRP